MNKMQRTSIAFIEITFAYGAGIEERIYIRFERHIYVVKCKWKCLKKSDRYPIKENTQCDQV